MCVCSGGGVAVWGDDSVQWACQMEAYVKISHDKWFNLVVSYFWCFRYVCIALNMSQGSCAMRREGGGARNPVVEAMQNVSGG